MSDYNIKRIRQLSTLTEDVKCDKIRKRAKVTKAKAEANAAKYEAKLTKNAIETAKREQEIEDLKAKADLAGKISDPAKRKAIQDKLDDMLVDAIGV